MFSAINALTRRTPAMANNPLVPVAHRAAPDAGGKAPGLGAPVRHDTFSRTEPGGGARRFSAGTAQRANVRFGSRETDLRVAALMQRLPDEQVWELSRFWRVLMASRQTPLGYTMFGDKPLSFISRDEVARHDLMPAYQIWSRQTRALPTDNTLFRIQCHSPGDSLPAIYIINKAAFLKTVERNQELFKKILGRNVTPHNLLDDIMRDNAQILNNKLNGSQRLYKLLLGMNPEDVNYVNRLGKLPASFIPVSAFDKRSPGNQNAHLLGCQDAPWLGNQDAPPLDNQNYTRVILPLCLDINGLTPTSFSLVKKWQDQQRDLQKLVNVPDDREFLAAIMRKWADAASYPELPYPTKESSLHVMPIKPEAVFRDPMISGE